MKKMSQVSFHQMQFNQVKYHITVGNKLTCVTVAILPERKNQREYLCVTIDNCVFPECVGNDLIG